MAKKSSVTAERANRELHKAESFLLSALLRDQHTQKNQTLFAPVDGPKSPTSFISIDEVGRGCVAGPVVVCATLWTKELLNDSFVEWVGGLRDSKKMTAASRELAFESALKEKFFTIFGNKDLPPVDPSSLKKTTVELSLKNLRYPIHQFKWTAQNLQDQLSSKTSNRKKSEFTTYMLCSAHIGFSSSAEIDSLGIVAALNLAAARALEGIDAEISPAALFFDGHRPLALSHRWAQTPQIMITKGDDLLKSISASSVIAKVVRDRWMEMYSSQFPSYFFNEHRGYGTEKHRDALLKHGLSPLHRKTFLKNICPVQSN
ncbi:MAG: hypothetical protein RI953_465 [Pseudomonadota bacterium]